MTRRKLIFYVNFVAKEMELSYERAPIFEWLVTNSLLVVAPKVFFLVNSNTY